LEEASVNDLARKASDQLRPVIIQTGFMPNASGSALISCGATQVICTATIEERVPPFLEGKAQGWLTAEYGMLPCSTSSRKSRDHGRPDGRGIEIQRLIGRALRPAVDLKLLGARTLLVDCDVLRADGGTRTASVTGACVAAVSALAKLKREGKLTQSPLKTLVAAVSVGVVGGIPTLDLCYAEDVSADVDCNVVMTAEGKWIEIQGTAEHGPFDRQQLEGMLALAEKGIRELVGRQKEALASDLTALNA
jgi:ribonuclease PH